MPVRKLALVIRKMGGAGSSIPSYGPFSEGECFVAVNAVFILAN
jgi:hypothetical protein